MARYAAPGTDGSVVTFKSRYDNFIGGECVAPVKGQYFENISPVTGEPFSEVARSHRRGHREGARRRARRRARVGQDLAGRPRRRS